MCPSLSSSSPFDKRVKTTMLCDTFHLVGFEAQNKKKMKCEEEVVNKKRLLGIGKSGKKEKTNFDIKNCRVLTTLEGLADDEVKVLVEFEEE